MLFASVFLTCPDWEGFGAKVSGIRGLNVQSPVENRGWGQREQSASGAGKEKVQGFPGGAVVENLPANAGDTGSSPGLGRSHMPRSD